MSRNREPPSKTCLRILESIGKIQPRSMLQKCTASPIIAWRIHTQCIHYSELRLLHSDATQLGLLPDRRWFHLINSLGSVNTYKMGFTKCCSVLPGPSVSPQVEKRPAAKGRVKSPSEKKSWGDEHGLCLCRSSHTPGASFPNPLKVEGRESLSVCRVISGDLSQQGDPGPQQRVQCRSLDIRRKVHVNGAQRFLTFAGPGCDGMHWPAVSLWQYFNVNYKGMEKAAFCFD